MKIAAIVCLSAVVAIASIHAHGDGSRLEGNHHNGKKCGTVAPTPRQMLFDQARLRRLHEKSKRQNGRGLIAKTCEEIRSEEEIVIDTYFHFVLDVVQIPIEAGGFEERSIVPHPTDIWYKLTNLLASENPDPILAEFYLSKLSTIGGIKQLMRRQIEVLNRDFGVDTPFQFRCANCEDPSTLANARYTRFGWTNWERIGEEIGQQGFMNLNIFLVAEVSDEVKIIEWLCDGPLDKTCKACLTNDDDNCNAFLEGVCESGESLLTYLSGWTCDQLCDAAVYPNRATLCDALCPLDTCCAGNRDISSCPGLKDEAKSLSFLIPPKQLNDGTLGAANFPSHQIASGDGFIVRYDTLPGGGQIGVDLGQTGTHEIGHWLGLYHVFQTGFGFEEDPCNPANPGDFIKDTPVMGGDSVFDGTSLINCTKFLTGELNANDIDTCPTVGRDPDPVFNHMNYLSSDDCFYENNRGHFTCGQVERMYIQWKLYREVVFDCGDGFKEVDVIIDFDEYHLSDNNEIFIFNTKSGTVIFDSRVDTDTAAPFSTDSLLINLCLPVGEYNLTVTDEGFEEYLPDGFRNGGSVEVFIAGIPSGSLTGDFGSSGSFIFNVSVSEVINHPTREPIHKENGDISLERTDPPSQGTNVMVEMSSFVWISNFVLLLVFLILA